MSKLREGENYPIYFGAKPGLFKLAGDLRNCMTHSEHRLWAQLRNRKLLGFKFRRQHPFNEIILDFFCYEAQLSIEVDRNILLTRCQKNFIISPFHYFFNSLLYHCFLTIMVLLDIAVNKAFWTTC